MGLQSLRHPPIHPLQKTSADPSRGNDIEDSAASLGLASKSYTIDLGKFSSHQNEFPLSI